MNYSTLAFFFVIFTCAYCRHIGEILCRQCGEFITRQSELINATGVNESFLKYKYDFPLVGKNTTVHVLKNPAGQSFHVFGAKTAHLKFHGPAQSDATWFPGMHWTICVCKACGKHMGWYFQPELSSKRSDKRESFVGIVLDNVISSDYTDGLVKTPL
ncbi:unnamed protein product [Caenorhabditis bovis]|uniref:CULT domain-containing protein n=1 Tax=Caenorhabditis bovis TaxID=2654633 RepID=A0A8S1EQ26_9PELO|nr:unnamed protein product [Caenorhabditis bovis]